MNIVLKIREVNYKVDNKIILKNISSEIISGPPKIILGPNGAGKTILMKICHGLIKPSSGSVIWTKSNQKTNTIQHTMVFQRPIMLRRSVIKNLLFVLASQGIKNKKKYKLVDDALNLVNMTDHAKFPARSLSQGEQQKLALARAWLLKPQVLFLDEPTANLDPKATETVENIVRKISNAGTLVLMTTHNIAQAKRIGSEILFLYNGMLKEKTNCNIFFSNPRTKEAKDFIEKEKIQ